MAYSLTHLPPLYASKQRSCQRVPGKPGIVCITLVLHQTSYLYHVISAMKHHVTYCLQKLMQI